MSSNSNAQAWWNLSAFSLPPGLYNDRRVMEAGRLRALLSYGGGEEPDGHGERLRRAATLLETSALDRVNVDGRIWEIVALIHEAIGVVEKEKRDYQWLLSALSWQLAESPSIAEHLAGSLMRSDSFSRRDLVEQVALAFSVRRFDTLRGLAEYTIDQGTRLGAEAKQSNDWGAAAEAVMLMAVGSALKNLIRYVTFLEEGLPDLTGLSEFVKLARHLGDSRRFRVGRLLSDCVHKFVSTSSRVLIEENTGLDEKTKQNILKHLRHYPELWPSQREAIDKGLLNRDGCGNNKKGRLNKRPISPSLSLTSWLTATPLNLTRYPHPPPLASPNRT